jgi:hypothetical protein
MKNKILLLVLLLFVFINAFPQTINIRFNEKKKSPEFSQLNLIKESGKNIIRNADNGTGNLLLKYFKEDFLKSSGDNKLLSLMDSGKYHYAIPEYNKKKNIFIPISEVIGFNFGLCAFNNYISGEPFAKISFNSVKHNLDTCFVWDNDVFVVNQFGHPYHGGIYFNAARSSGYNFWESVPFSFGGSMMWELFMETDPPQINDLINTTLGGVMVGEMLYRVSSLVLDESKTGTSRFFNEIFGFALSPMRGLNRLFSGDMWRHTPKNVHDVFPVSSRLNIGYSNITQAAKVEFKKHHLLMEYIFTYGKQFETDTYKPFDFFRVKFGFDTRKTDLPSSWASGYGLLYGKNLSPNNKNRFILGFFHDYDFFYNEIYRMGVQSIGVGLMYFVPENKKFTFNFTFHSNLVALSALNSIYREGENRDYDFLYGNKTMLDAMIGYGPVNLEVDYRIYILKTIDGWPGHHTLGMLNPKLLVNIYGGVGLGLEFIMYHRFGKFDSRPEYTREYNKRITEQRLYLTYAF